MFVEDQNTELKANLTDKFEIEIVAFLNSNNGGDLYIGVDDCGKPIGIDNLDETQLTIASRIKNNILPATLGLFDVLVEKEKGISYIHVIVTSGLEKPYYLRKKGMSSNGCFIRIGSGVQQMSTSMIDDMYSKRTRNSLSKIKSPRKNLEFEQLQIYYQSRGLTLNDKFAESLELLTEEDKYNYIAYLLADENSISIKVAKYAGIDKVDLIENEEYGYCSLIKAAKQVLDKLEIENKTTTRITRKERVEQKLINTIALREAVINAFVHNDYSSDVPPVIEIYSNRIEITSYGGLVSGMSENDFFSCKSMPRNRELIRVFKDVGLVEQLGSGMSRILKVYDKNVFEITENFLVVKFMFNKLVNEPLNELVNEPLNELVNEPLNELVNNTLSLNERKVLEIIKKDDKLTIKELSKKIKKSESTIKRIIALLKDKDLIQREGPDKNGKWIIK